RALREQIFGFMNRHQRRRFIRTGPGSPAAARAGLLRKADPPGQVVLLPELPDNHPALAYLRQRGLDPGELSRVWQVCYCTQAMAAFPMAQDRLIIPVFLNGICVGWQARHIGDRSWKQERLPKYITMPAMPRRLVLYNHDLARQQPLVVVCEGPS